MKITIVTESFPQISETFIINHIVSILKEGHNVNIISFSHSDKKITHGIYNDFNLKDITHYEKKTYFSKFSLYVSYIKNAAFFLFTSPIAFCKLIFNNSIKSKHTYLSVYKHRRIYNKSDIIHAHFGPIGKRVIELKKIGFIKSNIPIVCSFHGYDIDFDNTILAAEQYKDLFDLISISIVNSKYLENRLLVANCPVEKIIIQKVSLDINQFKSKNQAKTNIFNIVNVSRHIEFKGIKYLILAIKLLINKGYSNIHLSQIGQGDLTDELKDLTKSLHLENNITFFGAKSQEFIIEKLEIAQVLVQASIIQANGRTETQGLVIQEAQAMELPVIVTDVGGIPEGIIPDETGFLVPEKSPEAIAEKIEYLMLNPKIAYEMGKKGREFVKQKFDLQIIGEQTIQLYNQLLDEQN